MTKKQANAQPRSWAVIDDTGLVTNAVWWDGVTDWPHDETVIELGDQFAGIGFRWTGSEFVDERPEPEDVA